MSEFSIDVLCIGAVSYDLIFPVPRHPGPDEKMVSEGLAMCGGGPAANAAVTVIRLGGTAAFAGYLGRDDFGDRHLAELVSCGVDCGLVVRGDAPTPMSVVLVKPDGARSLVNQGVEGNCLPRGSVDLTGVTPRVILLDGHQPYVSLDAVERLRGMADILLDAGSVHPGTEMLLHRVDSVLCSERFALDRTSESDPERALSALAETIPSVLVTLGERGLLWKDRTSEGRMRAFRIDAVDTTGAGDVFHGAFALGTARGWKREKILRYASAAAALSCTRLGARNGIPTMPEVESFLRHSTRPS